MKRLLCFGKAVTKKPNFSLIICEMLIYCTDKRSSLFSMGQHAVGGTRTTVRNEMLFKKEFILGCRICYDRIFLLTLKAR